MKKLIYIFLISLLVGCDKEQPGNDYPNSNWGKPLSVIEYEDAAGTEVWETTTYYYDHLDRMTGYRRLSYDGWLCEEMLNSRFEGNVHTYDLHSYEWLGVPLPIVFHYTDTYTDATFSSISTRLMEAESMDWQETITYRYENGKQTGYRTVKTGQYPADFDTRITYRIDPRPSATTFPDEIEDEDNRVEMVFSNNDGNRTGYYSDNDYSRAQWNFNYGKGFCTYYTSRWGDIDMPHLVRVVFLPDGR